MDEAYYDGMMDLSMRDSSKIMREMVEVDLLHVTAMSMKVIGKQIEHMDLASSILAFQPTKVSKTEWFYLIN